VTPDDKTALTIRGLRERGANLETCAAAFFVSTRTFQHICRALREAGANLGPPLRRGGHNKRKITLTDASK